MTDKLPDNLRYLFQPRPAIRYLPPSDHAPENRTTGPIDGLAAFLPAIQEPAVPYAPTESWLQRKDRERVEKQEAAQKLVTEDVKNYNPHEDPKIQGNALKTLFVARLPYSTTTEELKSHFDRFGRVVNIRIVENEFASTEEKKKKRHQGYAFVEYAHEQEMKDAYKATDGLIIGGRRVLVDVERGRTVKGWRPVRYGGGLGGRGYSKEPPPRSFGGGYGGAPAGPGGFGGGRGGFRGGGFRGGRGGFEDRRGGGYRGGGGGYGGGGRNFGPNGAPEGAPSGPRGPRGGGYGGGGGGGGYGGGRPNGYGGGGGGGRYEDRGGGGFSSGGNREPLGGGDSRGGGGGGGYRDRDRDFDRKRAYEGSGGYDESRQRRRY